MKFNSLLFINLVTIEICNGRDFSYNGIMGPKDWSTEYSSCKGKHQSPINIDILHVKKVKLPSLNLHNFNKIPNITHIENNGHTVYFTIDTEENIPTIDGGPLSSSYQFSQLHYHWGDNDSYGSEDSFNGKYFPMELHVVFFKQEYKNIKEAMLKSDGLAVMAFFFEVSKPNPAYQELSLLLNTIQKPHTKANLTTPIALQDFIQTANTHEYYVYNGSLTTPPCLEVVTWLDFYDPIQISHDQLESFRQLEDLEGNSLSHNFRPVQPIGDRIVWFTSDRISENDPNLHENIHGKKKNNSQLPCANFMIILLMFFGCNYF
ncbi:CLUMA_CG019616, isoform A [Clunio marinus]|uniref:carbonic anhydrase n=1 Tax=Clunio marinus TaxID=568069 RepID=A0A1J1J1U8_9DIPT|nr:CLUMA_CG019616, isoform A [Clunio marinus]